MLLKSFGIIGRLFLALIASFAVFTMVAFLHGFFGDALQKKPILVQQRLVPLAMPKKHEEEPKHEQRIRIVKANTGRTGNTGGGQSSMRFVPDLGAESGPDNADGAVLEPGILARRCSMRGRPMNRPCRCIRRLCRFPTGPGK